MVQEVRGLNENVLLLDSGDMFRAEKRLAQLRAQIIFRSMEKMGYDAVNVAEGDLCLGLSFLNSLAENSSITRISTNLRDAKSGSLVYSPYLIKTVGTLRVGIIGLTEPSFFSVSQLNIEGLSVNEAIGQLKKFLPEVRRNADIVILLSRHLNRAGTLALLSLFDIDGVDIAIVGHNSDLLGDPIKVKDTIVVQNGLRAEYLGKLTVTVGEDKRIDAFSGELVHLSSDIPDAAWATEMIAVFRREEIKLSKQESKENQEKLRQEKLEALIRERQKLLKMSPEEAIKNLPVPTRKL